MPNPRNVERTEIRRHPSESNKDRQLETELDEALLGTFPASDSLSVTSTSIAGAPPRRDRS